MDPMRDEDITEKLINDLFREDELGSVVRAHLYIEYYVDEVLNKLVPFPKELKPLKLDYDGKLNLICALGVNPNVRKPLSILGGIRNRFAHRPNYALEKSDVNNLYNALEPDDKELLQKVYLNLRKDFEEWRNLPDYGKLDPKEKFILLVIVLRTIIRSVNEELTV